VKKTNNSVISLVPEPTNIYTQIILVEQLAKLLYSSLSLEEDFSAILPVKKLGPFILMDLAEIHAIFLINKDVIGIAISAIMNVLEPKSYIIMVAAKQLVLSPLSLIPSMISSIASSLAIMKMKQSFIIMEHVEQLAKLLLKIEQSSCGVFAISLAKTLLNLIIILQMMVAMLHVILLLSKSHQETIIFARTLVMMMKTIQSFTSTALARTYAIFLINFNVYLTVITVIMSVLEAIPSIIMVPACLIVFILLSMSPEMAKSIAISHALKMSIFTLIKLAVSIVPLLSQTELNTFGNSVISLAKTLLNLITLPKVIAAMQNVISLLKKFTQEKISTVISLVLTMKTIQSFTLTGVVRTYAISLTN